MKSSATKLENVLQTDAFSHKYSRYQQELLKEQQLIYHVLTNFFIKLTSRHFYRIMASYFAHTQHYDQNS